jgi:hypothetical protein
MSLKHTFEINPDDPFKNDKLKREEEAKTLTNLVKNYADGFVLAINNEWGSGKTTFVKMWQAHLKKEGVESLYFNAWENDYQEDVLVALLSELEELKDEEKANFDTVIKKAVPMAGKVASGALKALLATYGLDKVLQGAIDGAIEGGEELLKSEIDAYGKRKEGLKDFQESLENYAQAVTEEHPLVFIIDELDRCRPSYAVEVLEQVKHIFSVPGIVFVLAIDKIQLGHAVKGVYGSSEMDDVEYLRRFIDVEFSLPKPDSLSFIQYLYEYHKLREIILEPPHNPTTTFYIDEFCNYLNILSRVFNLRLRQVEKIVVQLKITLSTSKPVSGLKPALILLLAALKLKEEALYNKIKTKKIGEQELLDELADILPNTLGDNGWTIAILSYVYNNELSFRTARMEPLIREDAQGIKSLRLNYHHFNSNKNYLEYIERLPVFSDFQGLKLGRLISQLELSKKYFQGT